MKNNWISFDETKPEPDKLFLITNDNGYIEIAYFENDELMKPWKFDEYDTPAFNSSDKGLKWQYIELPNF